MSALVWCGAIPEFQDDLVEAFKVMFLQFLLCYMCFFCESDFPSLEQWVNAYGMKSCITVVVIIKICTCYLDVYEDVFQSILS